MADFTQSILRDYAQKKAGESKQGIMDELLSYGSTTSPTPYNLAADSYQGMITKGIGGLVDFAQSGERRAAAEAQQKLDAEETAYQRGRDTLRDSLSLEANQRAKEQFEFNKARQLKADRKEAAILETKKGLLQLQDNIADVGLKNKQLGQASLKALSDANVPLVVGKDGMYSYTGEGKLTDEQQTQLDSLNQSLISDPTEEVMGLIKKYADQVNNDNILDNDVSVHSLYDKLAGSVAKQKDSLNPIAQRNLDYRLKAAEAKRDEDIRNVYAKSNIAEGSLEGSIVDGTSNWVTNAKFDENYVKSGAQENLNLDDLGEVLDEIFEEGGHKDQILADENIAKAMELGILNDSLINKALGDIARNAEATHGLWGLADKDLADARYIRQVKTLLGKAIKGIVAKKEIDAIKNTYDTAARTANTSATILNR